MNTSAKSRYETKPMREMAEGVERSATHALETMGAASSGMADVFNQYCSATIRAVQECNSKLVEFTSINTRSHIEFVQKLASVKTPAEYMEVATHHGRTQLEAAAEQVKQLTELAQKASVAAAEPIRSGLKKVVDTAP